MTRKSRREIENALEDLSDADGDDVRAWAADQLVDGWEVSFEDRPRDGDEVLAVDVGAASVWVPESEVPEWVDVDEDLPVASAALEQGQGGQP